MNAYWVNKSRDTVPDVRLHLYMNAFRSNQTTYFREFGGSPGNEDADLGWIEIETFTDDNNADLLPAMKYISPDDGNPEDRTVACILLSEPALPGDTVHFNMSFRTKLSSFLRRTGYNDNFYFVGQWFPKFGVYEPAGMRNRSAGGWNCHQFHFSSEFYSDHSVYEVSINVPAEYIVGSSGLLVSEKASPERRKTLIYRAEDIVDFAWTAWPGFRVFTEQWKHVTVSLLISKERTGQVQRQFMAVRNALEFFDKNMGLYPWTYLTVVDPPLIGAGAGGMEYTTLFTSESSFIMPGWLHLPEVTTVHEFAHAYFMGMIASNESEEPWLDEGLTSFWEARIMDTCYGKNTGFLSHPLMKIPDIDIMRTGYVNSPDRQATDNTPFSWNYPGNTYSVMSYQKPALCLHTLMGIIGEETINDIFREYYSRWAFRHPSGRDFIDVANEVVQRNHGDKFGKDLNWYFDQTLYGTGICDYRVAAIENRKNLKPEGMLNESDSAKFSLKSSETGFTAVAQLERIGEVMLPLDILIHFTDGREVIEKWDGRSRFKDFTYTGSREIEFVQIDPGFRISLDVNYVNNSMTTKPDRVPLRRLVNRFMSFLQFFLSIILL